LLPFESASHHWPDSAARPAMSWTRKFPAKPRPLAVLPPTSVTVTVKIWGSAVAYVRGPGAPDCEAGPPGRVMVAGVGPRAAEAAVKTGRRRHRSRVHQRGDLAGKTDALDGGHGSAVQGQGGVGHGEGHRTGGAASGRRSKDADLIHALIIHIGSGNGGGQL